MADFRAAGTLRQLPLPAHLAALLSAVLVDILRSHDLPSDMRADLCEAKDILCRELDRVSHGYSVSLETCRLIADMKRR